MPYNQEVECPHCKANFKMPLKRHYSGKVWWGMERTLCGMRNPDGYLTVKEGETVNCKVCILRNKKFMQNKEI